MNPSTAARAGGVAIALLLTALRAGGEPVLVPRAVNGAATLAQKAAATLSPSNQLERLDRAHDKVFTAFNRGTWRFDQRFAADPQDALATPESRFRAVLYLQCSRDDRVQWRLDPDIDADFDLPNLERRLRLFIQSADVGELPGVDFPERRNEIQAGFRHIAKALDIESDLGVKGGLPPRGIAKVEWKPNWRKDDWLFYPRQRVFYDTEDRLGELTSISASRWLWKRTFLKSVSALRWTERSEGLEWEQTLIAGYVRGYLEPKHEGKIVGDSQTAQGISLRASVFGHKSADWLADRYRVTAVYRRPLHRRWIYLELAPGIEWTDEANWGAIPSIRLGLDCLFWGPSDPD